MLRSFLTIVLLLAASLTATAQQWQPAPELDTPRIGAAAVALDGMIYVMGGQDHLGHALATTVRYDPAAGTWEQRAEMQHPRAYAAAVVHQGRVFVIGGRDDEGKVLDDVEFYDPANDTWQTFDRIQEERQGLAAVLRNGSILVAGGSNENDELLDTVEFYDEQDGGWIDLDDDDDDGDDDDDELVEVELRGEIQALGTNSITVNDTTFVVDETTAILDHDDQPIAFGDLAVGMLVEVEGTIDDGSFHATRIKVEEEDDDDDDDDDGGNDDIQRSGPIDALGASSITVSGFTFTVTGETEIEDADGEDATFDDLSVGQIVQARGTYDDDDVLIATRIRILPGGPPSPSAAPYGITASTFLGTPRASFGAVTVAQRVIFLGGFGRVGPLKLVQEFHADDTLTELPELPAPRGGLAAVALGDSIIAVGGRDHAERVRAEALLLNLSEREGEWAFLPRMSAAREGAAAVALDGTIYVIGGRDAAERVLSSVETLTLRDTNSDADDVPAAHAIALDQNYPNPFSDGTTISFTVPTSSPGAPVHLSIYDLQGRRVTTLQDGPLSPGPHRLFWDGRTAAGLPVRSGVYFYRLQHDGRTLHKMMTVVR